MEGINGPDLTLSLGSLLQGSKKNKGKSPVTVEKSEGEGQRRVSGPSPQQEARLELAFRVDTLPDASTRSSLGEELGLPPEEVRKWFAKRRRQVRTAEESFRNHEQNYQNQALKYVNYNLKTATKNLICRSCGNKLYQPPPPQIQRLELENSLLRIEINQMKSYMNGLGLMSEDQWNAGSSRA